MSRLVLRHFEADGLATIVDLGFVPDMVKLYLDEGTNPDILLWFRRMVDDESVYGHLLTGSSGVVSRVTTAATGIEAYDTTQTGVLVDSPVPGADKAFAPVSDWAAASTTPTARSATAVGTIIRPPVHNGKVYECTTATGTYTSEPSTWPTTPGQTATDGGSNVWTCRDEEVTAIGSKGITIGASVSQNTDGNQIYLEAFKADKDPADMDAGSVAADIPI
jgi:hypothetical protein